MIERGTLEKLYVHDGLSIYKIGEILGVSPITVWYWLRKHNVPIRHRRGRQPTPIKLKLNRDLAYLLGLLLGNGYINKYKYSISLSTHSDTLARQAFSAFKSVGLNARIYHPNTTTIQVVAYSKVFAEWYLSLSHSDIENIIGGRNELVAAFLKGFYESNGVIWIDRGYTRISFIGVDRGILEFIYRQILKYPIKAHFYGPIKPSKTMFTRKPYYKIIINGRHAERFLEITKPCIKNYIFS